MLSAFAITLLASAAPRFCECSAREPGVTSMDDLVDKVMDRSVRTPPSPFRDLDSATLVKSGHLTVPTARLSSASVLPARPVVHNMRDRAPLGGPLPLAFPRASITARGQSASVSQPRMPIYYAGDVGGGGYMRRGSGVSGSAEPVEAVAE